MKRLLLVSSLALFLLGCPPSEPPVDERPEIPIAATTEPLSDGSFMVVMIDPVRLIWTPNDESDLAGYKVYIGTGPREYAAPATLGIVNEYPLDGLGVGKWYLAVTAFDTAGHESAYSNEVIYTKIAADDRDTLALRDDRLLRLLAVYEKRDLAGQPITPEIVLEWRQYSSLWSGAWAKLDTLPKNYMGGIYRDYTQAGDTLKVNLPYLALFNPDYLHNLDFRAKLSYNGKESAYASPQRVFRIIKGTDAGQPGELKLNVVE